MSEYASADVAHAALASRPTADYLFDDGSLTLLAEALPAFAGVPMLDSAAPPPPVPALEGAGHRSPADAPFRAERGAHVAAWDALASAPSDNVLAFNLIRFPSDGAAAYRAYAAHFAPLP